MNSNRCHRSASCSSLPRLAQAWAVLTLAVVTACPACSQSVPAPKLEPLRTGGLFQTWIATGFDNAIAGNALPGAHPIPPGRNYGASGRDLFRIRRAEVWMQTGIAPRTDFRVKFDLGRGITTSRAQRVGNVLRDLWIGYQLTPTVRVEVGQQVNGLTEEGSRSSADLLTPARAIMNEDLPLTAGHVGYEYDPGVVLRYRNAQVSGFVGIWNDGSRLRNAFATDRYNFLNASLYYSGIRHVVLGVWGGKNVLAAKPAEGRERLGATFLVQHGPNFMETEFAYARDYAAGAPAPGLTGTISDGGYVLYAHAFSRKWQAVARYDIWDPAAGAPGPATTENGITLLPFNHKLKEYTLGFNYYIRSANAKIQVNLIREDAEPNAAPFFGVPRTILLTGFQVAF